MQLRVVRVTVAPGKSDEYWAWAKEIVALWDAHNVVRAGGPYRLTGPGGEDVALWLTVHHPGANIQDEFREMYGSGRGKELIEQRPPLVAETTSTHHNHWDFAAGDPPAAPAW